MRPQASCLGCRHACRQACMLAACSSVKAPCAHARGRVAPAARCALPQDARQQLVFKHVGEGSVAQVVAQAWGRGHGWARGQESAAGSHAAPCSAACERPPHVRRHATACMHVRAGRPAPASSSARIEWRSSLCSTPSGLYAPSRCSPQAPARYATPRLCSKRAWEAPG